MEYRKFNDKIFVRLDKGDEIMTSLAEVCACEGVTAAQVTGIGGCSRAVTGVFDAATREYNREEINELLELVSLCGNVTVYEGKPYLHLHASFAYHDDGMAKTLSGHLLEAQIGLTGEIIITPVDGCISRRYDDSLGIRVWDFS